METTIDAAGRLVIPKAVRQQARPRPGMVLDMHWREGRIEIEPAPLPIELVRAGRLLVAVPRADVGAMTEETVEQTRDALWHDRPSTC